MNTWLDPVREALDHRDRQLRCFFRDDDAGWANRQLDHLLDLFAKRDLPIDLAVIPASLTDTLTDALLDRIEHRAERIGLHQHGYTHSNHEQRGRKYEFGNERSYLQQLTDIRHGWRILRERLDGHLQPIFTPPWNRCTQSTVEALQALGFKGLSRDIGAKPLAIGIIEEFPVHIDWCKKQRDGSCGNQWLASRLVERIADSDVLGIMLHHENLDDVELCRLEQLIKLMGDHQTVRFVPMKEASSEKYTLH